MMEESLRKALEAGEVVLEPGFDAANRVVEISAVPGRTRSASMAEAWLSIEGTASVSCDPARFEVDPGLSLDAAWLERMRASFDGRYVRVTIELIEAPRPDILGRALRAIPNCFTPSVCGTA